MTKKLYVTLVVTLPDDPFDAAAIFVRLQPSWASLLETLKAGGTEYDIKIQELEQRGKARGRPRKLRVVVPDAPEAA
jgi:hypothetical protein